MNDPIFTGTCTAMVTPFRQDTVNYAMLEQLIHRQIDAGIRAIVICGTTGESPVLSDCERIKMFEKAKQYAGDHCKIIAGTGSNATDHAIALSQAAEAAGADALLVVSPYYNKATADGLVMHYTAIANSVTLPVILYNVPSRTGVDIPVDVYHKLSLIPNVSGVKEASADIMKIIKTKQVCPDDFYIWCGNDDRIVPVMSMGCVGVISVLSNVAPEKTKALTDAALAGDFTTASRIQLEMLPLIELLFSEVNPIPVKAAMREIGYDCGECRLPLTPLSERNRVKLKKMLSH